MYNYGSKTSIPSVQLGCLSDSGEPEKKRLVLYSEVQHDLLLEFGVVLVFHPLCFQMWELRFLSWAWCHPPVSSGGRGKRIRSSRPARTTGDLVSKQKQNPNPKHTNWNRTENEYKTKEFTCLPLYDMCNLLNQQQRWNFDLAVYPGLLIFWLMSIKCFLISGLWAAKTCGISIQHIQGGKFIQISANELASKSSPWSSTFNQWLI